MPPSPAEENDPLYLQSDDILVAPSATSSEVQDTPQSALPQDLQQTTSSEGASEKTKHQLLEGCNKDKCPKKCHSHFNQVSRESIHSNFWKLNYNMRRVYLRSRILLKPVCRRRIADEISRKGSVTKIYTFQNSEGKNITVCQKFFLHTLGYKQDQVIKSLFTSISAAASETASCSSNSSVTVSADSCVPEDARGRKGSTRKIDKSPIYSHIESFKPAVSHFRREHAPNVRLSKRIICNFTLQAL